MVERKDRDSIQGYSQQSDNTMLLRFADLFSRPRAQRSGRHHPDRSTLHETDDGNRRCPKPEGFDFDRPNILPTNPSYTPYDVKSDCTTEPDMEDTRTQYEGEGGGSNTLENNIRKYGSIFKAMDFEIEKSAFVRILHDMTRRVRSDLQMNSSTANFLQFVSEQYLIALFEGSSLLARH